MGIIKTIIGSELDAMINLILDNCLRYGGSDIKVMLDEVIMKNACVEVCDSRSMHVW